METGMSFSSFPFFPGTGCYKDRNASEAWQRFWCPGRKHGTFVAHEAPDGCDSKPAPAMAGCASSLQALPGPFTL